MQLDPVLHQAQRLQIMAALFRSRQASFRHLQDRLQMTAGNLQSHGVRLQEAGYIHIGRAIAGNKFEVRYRITPEGSRALLAYARMVKELLDLEEGKSDPPARQSGGEGA